MNENTKRIVELSNGKRTSIEIAKEVGLTPRYVRKVQARHSLPTLTVGSRPGAKNHQYKTGRRIDHDGYVLVTAPHGHPHARMRKGRRLGIMFEHRLVIEQSIGRYLLPEEVVDHIDGLTLHNAEGNLRIFESNGDHLRATTTGKPRLWSPDGLRNIGARIDRGSVIQRIDSYGQRKKLGEIRLRQILLAGLSLGIDSPYLLGSSHHLEKAGIVDLSHSSLQRELADLYRKWGWPPPQ